MIYSYTDVIRRGDSTTTWCQLDCELFHGIPVKINPTMQKDEIHLVNKKFEIVGKIINLGIWGVA